jgi:hypothetical protein
VAYCWTLWKNRARSPASNLPTSGGMGLQYLVTETVFWASPLPDLVDASSLEILPI